MKFILSIFIAALCVPAISLAQVRVSRAQLQQVIKLSKDGQTDRAIAKIDSLRRTVTVRDSMYMFLLGISEEINSKANYYEQAIRDNEDLIKLIPPAEASCLTAIGQYKSMLGDFDGAIAAYTRLLELDKQNQRACNNLVSVYNQAGKYKDALRVLDSRPAKDRVPQDQYEYAVAYYKLNMPDSARSNIARYLRAGTTAGDFQSYILAARIYAALGDKKKSCEHITQANDIITKSKAEEQIKQNPARVQAYYFAKEMFKEIGTARELKTKLCE
jgi:tetratricopeptide (TPR) repeat protein